MRAAEQNMNSVMSESEACRYIIDLVYDRSRIRLHSGKEALIRARLGKRIRAGGFLDLPEYCEFLRSNADPEELSTVVEALTTNFTSFLREEDHFRFLVEQAHGMVEAGSRKRLRVWSAACSSGEEPYTIALYLAEHCPLGHGWDWTIAASDISSKVLDKARAGIYSEDRIQAIPGDWLKKYFQKGIGRFEGQYRIKPALASRVEFRQINLVEHYDHPEPFEIIFCRNVMIYFDRHTQAQLVRKLCDYLKPGGHLVIGHSESLNGLHLPLRCLRPSIYQRIAS